MKNSIFVNQIGYSPKNQKFAFVDSEEITENYFELCDEKGNKVFSGELGKVVFDDVSKQKIRIADFSEFEKKGNYFIKVGTQKSYKFSIANKIYDDCYTKILTYFTYSRCGQEVKAGEWSHPACHTSSALIYGTNTKKNVLGGWHDAGDYGRYVVAGTKAVMDLIFAYESTKDSYSAFDILNEIRFELDWLLQMQREDGAVFHKISCYNFCKFIFPDKEKEEIVLSPISTAATADFAGCLSFCSKFFEKSDKDYSKKLLDAAIKAQDYLYSNKDELYTNPPEITTGGYGDHNVADERYFALCGLYSATGNKKYLTDAIKLREKDLTEFYFWGCVTAYGTEILLKYSDLSKDKEIRDELEKAILNRAEKIYSIVVKASFRTSMLKVHWGSNGFVCDEAHLLLLAYEISKEKKYYDAALSQLDYILGCNPFNLCYVSCVGTDCIKKPHHRPSGAAKKVMPGMLSGGPSEGLQDEIAKEKLEGRPPLSCFIDDERSFSTNEVAIYWNSALVLLVARLGLV